MLKNIVKEANVAGVWVIPIQDAVKYINSVRVLGVCRGTDKKGYQIYLSQQLLGADIVAIKNVLAHEVCHAVQGSKGHDRLWREAADKLQNEYGYVITQYDIEGTNGGYNYVIECDTCGAKTYRVQKVKISKLTRCKKCSSTYGFTMYDSKGNEVKTDGVFKYIVKCTECSFEAKRERSSNLIQRPEMYICPKCDTGGVLSIIVNY